MSARCAAIALTTTWGGPSLDIHQLVPVDAMEHDPVDATTPVGAAAERNRRHRRAPRLELLPGRLVRHELVPRSLEPRVMRVRRFASARGTARIARNGLARRVSA